ncbi:MAG: HAD family hydrolase [Candidatus Omnitrophota bacterium]
MKIIFLDRDGVINKYPGDKLYVVSTGGYKFLPGAKKAIAELNKAGFKVFIISNQAGVGKGVFSPEALKRITAKLLGGIKKAGGRIEQVIYCTHRPEENCACRKPKAGSINLVRKSYKFNPRKTFFIGDSIRDVETAHAAGLKSILVLSGREKLENFKNWQDTPEFIFKGLASAVNYILQKQSVSLRGGL